MTTNKEKDNEPHRSGQPCVLDSRYLGCFCYVSTCNVSLLTPEQLDQILEGAGDDLLPETLKQQAD